MNIIKPAWSAPAVVQAFCSTRTGGVSQAPFDSFNLAGHVGDNPDHVRRNRAILMQSQNLPSQPNWLVQSHSATVVTLESEQNRHADAAITRQPGTIAVVMTADCLPILLCNLAGTEIAAVHAGWRGLHAGVVQQTLAKMLSPANQLIAWIGPAISQPRFEVGDEVRQAYIAKNDSAQSRFIANQPGRWLCDLAGLACDLLIRYGVQQVYRSNLCSYTNQDQYFSYRRDALTGRMASLIWIQSGA